MQTSFAAFQHDRPKSRTPGTDHPRAQIPPWRLLFDCHEIDFRQDNTLESDWFIVHDGRSFVRRFSDAGMPSLR
jgi:hypothetical protein